ncbi:MAG: hypothetical protein WC655_04145 [Candidatus Hydrogenedentales bacterium]|jgi:hypothetical protein
MKSSSLSFDKTVTYTKTPPPATPAPSAPAPDAGPPAPGPGAPTAAELLKRQAELYKAMWGANKPTPEPAAEEAATPAPAVTPSPQAPPSAPATPPSDEPAPAPEPTTAELIAQSAKATGEAIATALKQPERAEVPEPAFEMSAEDRQDYETLLYLEKTDPKKWSGKAAEYLAYLKLHYAYQDDWQAKNPKEEFNADDDEHKGWYEAHQPQIDPEALKEARMREAAEKAAMEKVQPVLDEINREKAVREAMPKIAETVTGLIVDMVDRAAPELGALLRKDGKLNITLETIASVEAKSRIGKRILDEVVKFEMEPLLLQLEMSVDPRFGVALNPAVNQVHARIDQYRAKAEAEMLNAPPEVQVQDGRAFATIEQMQQMRSGVERGAGSRADKDRKLADLGSKFYTLTVDDIEALIVKDCGEMAKKRIAQAREDARMEFGESNGNRQPDPTPQPAQEQPQPTPAPRMPSPPRPPSMSSSSDLVTAPATAQKPGETLLKVMYGQ